ncbi:hypothetical protein JAAARDRAFT_60080 [Jaapia argillacea MUCL 33604]|uniref:Major facilitator superfamily (MFS) profile domain-containing protein n=1 Tax=Jaapia argillacea MUCL 33604 TaxID=933084 RepID=A0A067PJN7_9AGAM|nr:hypothetical protein JAAARDRAFT_60080 [Jaapia argillacea MUCL 33604]
MATRDTSSFERKEDAFVEQIEDSSVDDGRLLSVDERLAAEARIKRKLDIRLMSTMILIYLMNYIDRTAITAARLKGIEQDLHLSDLQYEVVVAILYVSYCPAQIPSNMILNKVTRPSLYIGCCVIAWGLVSAMTGVTKSFGGIVLCRVFIGLPEAAFYPGAVYLLSRWYTKTELCFRSAILYAGLLMSNAFGALIAAGILSGMEGVRGIRAWRWLFYIEGAVTICIGFYTMWALPDFPHNTRWLTPAERRLAQARLAEDAGEADEDSRTESAWTGFRLAITDPKVPVFMLLSCSQLLGLSFVNFFPTIAGTMGFNTTITLLMAAPPWIFASIVTLVNAYHADKTGERFFHIAGWWWVVIVGYIIGVSTMAVPGRYVCMFLMASGYAGFAITLTWVSNAIPRPPAKRSAAIGLVNGFGNIGNLIGSFIWKANWGPRYHQSMVISISDLVLSSSLAMLIRWMLKRDNRLLAEQELKGISTEEKERIAEAGRLEGITFEEAMERKRGFRYLY